MFFKFIYTACNRGYCTCFWDNFKGFILTPCCKLHDASYTRQRVSRWKADAKFYNCLKKHANKTIAVSMWFGVRVAGWHFWKKAQRSKNEK